MYIVFSDWGWLGCGVEVKYFFYCGCYEWGPFVVYFVEYVFECIEIGANVDLFFVNLFWGYIGYVIVEDFGCFQGCGVGVWFDKRYYFEVDEYGSIVCCN